MGLRLKFNLAMLFALAIGYGLTGYAVHSMLQENARAAVLDMARIMRESALAIRSYTVEEVGPLMQTLSVERFLPHTVPSFAAQTNFRQVREAFPDYAYKEAALNPTNPSDRATDWEADIIHAFRNDDALRELILERDTPTGQSLVLAHPIRITNEACLQCHSTPAAAPASMIALYGEANGFGWKLDEIIGAQIVSVPMRVALERANQTFSTVMISLGAVFLTVFVILNLLLSFSVVRPIRRLSTLANEVSLGNLDAPELEPAGGGEIATLTAAFNRMRRSLENAMRMFS